MAISNDVDRRIIICSPINKEVSEHVIDRVTLINAIDSERKDILASYNPEPIEMYINSGGGGAGDGFAIIDAMRMSDTPIVTYGLGTVASMALGIFVAGDLRISGRYTRFMYHAVRYGWEGVITEHEEQLLESDLIQRMYNSLFIQYTGFTKEKLEEVRKMKKDYFFSAKEAIQLGVADEIIKQEEDLEVTE